MRNVFDASINEKSIIEYFDFLNSILKSPTPVRERKSIEKSRVSTAYLDLKLPEWSSIKTLIKVESQRQLKYKTEFSTRYYICDLRESAFEFYQRIRGYWGVENKVHYVRDVTQGEDKSRIRTTPLPQILAIARNLALNLYRNAGFDNIAQAKRKCQFSLKHISPLFRMK